MEIDNINRKNYKKKYTTLSKTEKQRRKDFDLCAYCGSPNHQIDRCDLLPFTSNFVNAAYLLKGNTRIFTFYDFLNAQN